MLLLVEIILYTMVIPSKEPVKISFTGLQMYSPEEMYRILNTNTNQTWSNFDSAKAAAILADCPWIESVSVEKKFPDSVSISVKERIPVAATLLNIKGKTLPVQIDESGVLFTAKAGIVVVLMTIFTLCISDLFDSIGIFIGTGKKSGIFKISKENKLIRTRC